MAEKVCEQKRQLKQIVESHLEALRELVMRERDAVNADAENTWRAIDDEIERRIGEKERALGALSEHRKQHGC